MSFSSRIATITVATIVAATNAHAEGHTSQLLSNFSIGGFSAGDINVAGSPNTVINAAKDGFNDSQISLDFNGIGCGQNCATVIGNAATSVYELAFVNADTVGDHSGELYGSSTAIDLTAGAQLEVADTQLRDTSTLDLTGDAYGVAVGDDVSVVSFQEAFGKVKNELTYHGPICPGSICGNADQAAWVMGGMSQAVHTTAHGHETVAISNVTDSHISALLDSYKGPVE